MSRTTLAHLFSLKPDIASERPVGESVRRGGWAIANNAVKRKILDHRLQNFLRPRNPKITGDKLFQMNLDRSIDCCFILPRTKCAPHEDAIQFLPYPRLVQEIDRLSEQCAPRARDPLERVVGLTMRSTQDAEGPGGTQHKMRRALGLMERLTQFEQLLDEVSWTHFTQTIAPGCPHTVQSFVTSLAGGFYGQPEMEMAPRALEQSFFLTNKGYKDALGVYLNQNRPGDILRHSIVRLERFLYKTITDAKTTLQIAKDNIKLTHDTAMLIAYIVPQEVQAPNVLLFDQCKNPLLPLAAPKKRTDLEIKQAMLHDFTTRARYMGLVQDRTHDSTTSGPLLSLVVKRIDARDEPHASHQTESDAELKQRGGCRTTTDNLIDHGDFGQRALLERATPAHALVKSSPITSFVMDIFNDPRVSQGVYQEYVDARMVTWLTDNLERTIDWAIRNPNVVALANGLVLQDGRFEGMFDVGAQTPVNVYAVQMVNCACRRTAHAQIELFFDASFLPTSTIDKITGDQGWNEMTQRSYLFMLGRSRFPVGHDALQVMVNMQGVSGCGKSTAFRILQTYYTIEDVAAFVTRMETTFGLGWMAKLFIAIGPDLGKSFSMVFFSSHSRSPTLALPPPLPLPSPTSLLPHTLSPCRTLPTSWRSCLAMC